MNRENEFYLDFIGITKSCGEVKNYFYHLALLAYVIRKYDINLDKEYESYISFVEYINKQINNYSFSNYEKNLVNQSLMDLLNVFKKNPKIYKKLIELINGHDRQVILDSVRQNYDETNDLSNLISELVNKLLSTKKNGRILNINCGKGNFLVDAIDYNDNVKVSAIDQEKNNQLITNIRLYLMNCEFDIFDNLEVHNDKLIGYDSIFCTINKDIKKDDYIYNLIDDSLNKKSGLERYIDIVIKQLNPNGRAVIILPSSLLLKSDEQTYREYLINNEFVEGIIELPEKILFKRNIQFSMIVLKRNSKLVKLIESKSFDNSSVDQIYNQYINGDTYIDRVDMSKKQYSFLLSSYLHNSNTNIENGNKLVDIVKIFRGLRTKKDSSDSFNEKCKIIQIGNMNEEVIDINSLSEVNYLNNMEKYLLKNKDILLTSKGSKFQCSIIQSVDKQKIIASENLFVIRAIDEKINPYYLLEYLNSNIAKQSIFDSHLKTNKISISINEIQNMSISLKSKEIQDEIGTISKNKCEFILDSRKKINNDNSLIISLFEKE